MSNGKVVLWRPMYHPEGHRMLAEGGLDAGAPRGERAVGPHSGARDRQIARHAIVLSVFGPYIASRSEQGCVIAIAEAIPTRGVG